MSDEGLCYDISFVSWAAIELSIWSEETLNQIILFSNFTDLPKLVREDCSDSDSSDEEKWLEEDDEVEETRGLFDDKTFPSLEEAIADLKKNFNFDLAEMKQKHSMDFYSYIKVSVISGICWLKCWQSNFRW